MADKKFGVKQLDLIGTGTPTIQSANNLNLNATTTAISNDVTIGGDLTVTGSITGSSAGIPSGVIMLWSGAANAIPTGYVLCDGNNSTPDLRDKFVVGASNSTGDNTYPGLSPNATPGGSADATLVSHSHTINYYEENQDSGDPARFTPYRQSEANTYSSGTQSTNSQGSSATNANLPPYYALCYIMKT